MDDNALRNTWREVNPIRCPFENALAAQRCRCEKVVRVSVAEREALGCSSEELAGECAGLLREMHHNALFVLHLTHADEVLPYAKEMKVQVGGLLGLQTAMQPEGGGTQTVESVYRLVTSARVRFGEWEALPYGEIVKAIAAFELRRKR